MPISVILLKGRLCFLKFQVWITLLSYTWHILYAGKKSYWTNGEIHKKRGECPDSKAQRSQKRAAKGRHQKKCTLGLIILNWWPLSAHLDIFLLGRIYDSRPPSPPPSKTFSNLFWGMALRNDHIWPFPWFITCFRAFLDVFSTKEWPPWFHTKLGNPDPPTTYLGKFPKKHFLILPKTKRCKNWKILRKNTSSLLLATSGSCGQICQFVTICVTAKCPLTAFEINSLLILLHYILLCRSLYFLIFPIQTKSWDC